MDSTDFGSKSTQFGTAPVPTMLQSAIRAGIRCDMLCPENLLKPRPGTTINQHISLRGHAPRSDKDIAPWQCKGPLTPQHVAALRAHRRKRGNTEGSKHPCAT